MLPAYFEVLFHPSVTYILDIQFIGACCLHCTVVVFVCYGNNEKLILDFVAIRGTILLPLS